MFPALRWCLVVNAIWILGVAGFVWRTHVSVEHHLNFSDTWTPKIVSTNDMASQKELNLLLLKAVDNRIAAVKALQRHVIGLAVYGGTLGVFNVLFLLRLHRSLRREVHYTIKSSSSTGT
jgi:hypothetical protein